MPEHLSVECPLGQGCTGLLCRRHRQQPGGPVLVQSSPCKCRGRSSRSWRPWCSRPPLQAPRAPTPAATARSSPQFRSPSRRYRRRHPMLCLPGPERAAGPMIRPRTTAAPARSADWLRLGEPPATWRAQQVQGVRGQLNSHPYPAVSRKPAVLQELLCCVQSVWVVAVAARQHRPCEQFQCSSVQRLTCASVQVYWGHVFDALCNKKNNIVH